MDTTQFAEEVKQLKTDLANAVVKAEALAKHVIVNHNFETGAVVAGQVSSLRKISAELFNTTDFVLNGIRSGRD